MIVYISDPQNSTRELLQLINTLSNVGGYKINSEKSVALLYTNDKEAEKETRETSPFIIATNNIKYLRGITKQRNERPIWVSLWRNWRRYQKMGRFPMLLDSYNQHNKNGSPTKRHLEIQCNPHQKFQHSSSALQFSFPATVTSQMTFQIQRWLLALLILKVLHFVYYLLEKTENTLWDSV